METKCHRNYQFGAGILPMVPVNLFENNFASVFLSLYIKYRFLEIWFCLFVIFHSYGNVTIAGEGLQILTYARQSWPLSSEGSLSFHAYCDRDPGTRGTHTYCWARSSEAVTTCFYDLGLSRLWYEHLTFCLRGERLKSAKVKVS